MNTKKNNKLTFGLLGLGTVVNLRIYKLLKNELSDKVKVISVFDKNKKKNIDYSNRFNCKFNENEKNFFQVILNIVIYLLHQVVIIKIF